MEIKKGCTIEIPFKWGKYIYFLGTSPPYPNDGRRRL